MASKQPNTSELMKQLEALRAENEALKLKADGVKPFSIKISPKGAISVYGLGRFPVTLYRQQMERFLAHAEDIKAFIAANADRLSLKPAGRGPAKDKSNSATDSEADSTEPQAEVQ